MFYDFVPITTWKSNAADSEIFIQLFTHDTTHAEILEALKADNASRQALNLPELQLGTIDNCCTGRSRYSLDDKEDSALLNLALAPIVRYIADCPANERISIGLDMEWDTVSHAKSGKACVIQFAVRYPDLKVFVIQFKKNLTTFPVMLKGILESSLTLKVWNYLKQNEQKYLDDD
ncbi:UNVERIFIED_CONTAM: hypothetical protein HDU68_003394 [Siphonaria sp. JEL0065]|nr:hypothetical protein HDU68_003394 [Siphonaria sp. JEL0065]